MKFSWYGKQNGSIRSVRNGYIYIVHVYGQEIRSRILYHSCTCYLLDCDSEASGVIHMRERCQTLFSLRYEGFSVLWRISPVNSRDVHQTTSPYRRLVWSIYRYTVSYHLPRIYMKRVVQWSAILKTFNISNFYLLSSKIPITYFYSTIL